MMTGRCDRNEIQIDFHVVGAMLLAFVSGLGLDLLQRVSHGGVIEHHHRT